MTDNSQRDVLKAIRHAAETRAPDLDLSNRQLRELPPEIGQLASLQTLDLNGNQLAQIPPEIGQLARLLRLDLDGNQLAQIPPEIGQLASLQTLYLNGNQLAQIPPEIGQLANLQELYLHGNQLAQIPPEIGQLARLQVLRLDGNRLAQIPPEIGQLANLQTLYLNGNQLAQIPPEIGQLASLQVLRLDGNQLAQIPPEIGQLARLLRLDLDGNQLAQIPPEIGQLARLLRLDLDGNQLAQIPPEIGQLANLQTLYLHGNQLAQIPPEIGQLANLQELRLDGNRLAQIPPEIGQLANLQELYLHGNQLAQIPPEIGQLANLQTLYLHGNQLAQIPPEIGQLANLQELYLHGNQLAQIPPEIGQLANLQVLRLHGNQLAQIPPEIGQLASLQTLDLDGNQLTEIPAELANPTNIKHIIIDNNPLNDSFQIAADGGTESLLAYLKSLLNQKLRLFEAKLILVGEGGVGKTSLLGALLEEDFVENRPTTHGVEIKIQPILWPHPTRPDVTLTLNAWDFGGQSIYRVTHQFFFSRRSLYVVVWSPRFNRMQNDVEGWLDRIKLRVGEQVRVLVVATHSETGERFDRINEDEIRERFGPMVVGFHRVDSETGAGIDELKKAIAREAAKLPHMDTPLSVKWKAASDEIRALGRPTVAFKGQYSKICKSHGLDSTETKALATLMNELGHIIHYGDGGLDEIVILKPELLSKAIGYVLEDRRTNQDSGILEHTRLADIWHDHKIKNRAKYPKQLHRYFLRLMERFDVSYRFEGDERSLVGQLVPENRPELPWLPSDDVPPGQAQLRLICVMPQDPPPGLVPWSIVRNHRYRTPWQTPTGEAVPGRHWQEGVFLAHGRHGEALMELIDREFALTVRAGFPSHFLTLLIDGLEYLIKDRWPGLDYQFAVPCPHAGDDGKPCRGRLKLEFLRKVRTRGRTSTDCPECAEAVDIEQLLFGLNTPDLELQRKLDRLQWSASESTQKLDRLQWSVSESAQQIRRILKAIESEARECPRLFTLLPESLKPWNPSNLGMTGHCLTLWCEMPDDEHPLCRIGSKGEGEYHFKRAGDWLHRAAPSLNCIAGALKLATKFAGPTLKAMFPGEEMKPVISYVEMMATTTGALLEGKFEVKPGPSEPYQLRGRPEGADLREFQSLLMDVAKDNKKWGGLRRVINESGDYLWLCPKHHAIYEPPLPKIPGTPTAPDDPPSAG